MNIGRSLGFCGLLLLAPMLQAAGDLPTGIIAAKVSLAPPMRLADMDGEFVDIQQLRGQWVFVHFWASWCGPCRREMPHIEKLQQLMGGQGLGFMIVNTAEDEDTVFSFLGGVAPDLNSLMDRDGLATEKWQPRGLPATYLVDPAGVIRYQALGGREWHRRAYTDFLARLVGDGF